MKVSKIQIKDFKGFKDLTIDLGDRPARIIALVGPNGCGKSSVFDAILMKQFAYNARIGELKLIHSNSTSVRDFFNKLENNTTVEINLQTNDNQHISLQNFIQQTITNKRNIFSFRSPYRYNTDLKIKETKSVDPIENNEYGASASIFIDRRIEDNYRHLLAHYNKYRDDNDVRPSDAKKEVIGRLNSCIKSRLNLEIYSLGDVEGNRGTLFSKSPTPQKNSNLIVYPQVKKKSLIYYSIYS